MDRRLALGAGAKRWEYCDSYNLDGMNKMRWQFFPHWMCGLRFNALMVSSLLPEEVDFSNQACGVTTKISEKLVGSIPLGIPPIYSE